MFTIQGDLILWDGEPVAVLFPDVLPSVRATVEDRLRGGESDDTP